MKTTKAFFDTATFTLTYVVYDEDTCDAVIIDPVLDLDPLRWSIGTHSIEAVKEFVSDKALRVRYILDTHAHADHLSGMHALKEVFQAPTAIGEHIRTVQETFANVYNLRDFATDGSQWDTLLADGDTLHAGSIEITSLHTPGHTPACLTFKIGDAVYTGDALFMPDYGTGRCDFPRGSASDLYDSVHGKLYKLHDSTRVFVGHDYLPGGRDVQYETTIGESKANNVRLNAAMSREEFVSSRKSRDSELPPPNLILQSLQVNIRAGELPPAEDNQRIYFKIPINLFDKA